MGGGEYHFGYLTLESSSATPNKLEYMFLFDCIDYICYFQFGVGWGAGLYLGGGDILEI